VGWSESSKKRRERRKERLQLFLCVCCSMVAFFLVFVNISMTKKSEAMRHSSTFIEQVTKQSKTKFSRQKGTTQNIMLWLVMQYQDGSIQSVTLSHPVHVNWLPQHDCFYWVYTNNIPTPPQTLVQIWSWSPMRSRPSCFGSCQNLEVTGLTRHPACTKPQKVLRGL